MRARFTAAASTGTAFSATAPASRLGLARLIVGGYTLWYLSKQRQKFRKLVDADPALFEAVGPVRVLDRPLPAPVAQAITDASLVSTVLFTLGVRHRVLGPLHSGLLTWTLSYRNSWSMIFHSENTLVWHTLVLAASPAADAVSIDALVRRGSPPRPHPRYGWPLHALQGTSAAVYLLSGLAKIFGTAGFSWVDGNQLRRQVAKDQIRKHVYGSDRGARVAQALYPRRGLFTTFAAASLALELGAPLGLLHPRAGRAWAVATFGMHWGIRTIMGIRFRYQLCGAAFAPWFRLERLIGLLKPAFTDAGRRHGVPK